MASKVLIIEDDNTFGIVLKKWFDKNGFDAFVKSTLDEARKDLLKTDFKLIITDRSLKNRTTISNFYRSRTNRPM